MNDCIFCKIVKGELPSYKLFEDELFFGFLDIFPRTRGHALVIPKNHHRWVYDVPEFEEYWNSVNKLTKALQKALNPYFVSYVTHGLEVPHAHIHVLPRYEDETMFVPDTKKFSQEQMEETAQKIKKFV
ncbi:MAG: HIT domain-containing protein [Microgenomates group bacterium]|jgi:histidine triad (HIT) family protein|nr:HIT domain-containing protein [Candidatus Woesebacteria bacterium]MBP6883408.1 HIT domain-containing protein [Candidatus Woesebacteria bacterium]QQR63799.1 MAG: HIT domain-containing protein [Candidatus Roizmanbacteria bacterium]